MPGFIGKKLCPELVLVPPHFDKYRAVSKQVREILAEYDPNFCPMSLDEAYFDLTEYLERRRRMSAEERTYLYCSAEDHGQVEDEKKSTSDKAANNVSIQERTSDEDGYGSSGDYQHQSSSGVDQSLFTSVSKKQREVTSGKVLSVPAEIQVESPCRHGNTNNASSLEDSRSKAERGEQPEQGVEDEDNTCGTKRQDGRFETFGVTCEEVVREIRFRIEQKTKLTASAGECWV